MTTPRPSADRHFRKPKGRGRSLLESNASLVGWANSTILSSGVVNSTSLSEEFGGSASELESSNKLNSPSPDEEDSSDDDAADDSDNSPASVEDENKEAEDDN